MLKDFMKAHPEMVHFSQNKNNFIQIFNKSFMN